MDKKLEELMATGNWRACLRYLDEKTEKPEPKPEPKPEAKPNGKTN